MCLDKRLTPTYFNGFSHLWPVNYISTPSIQDKEQNKDIFSQCHRLTECSTWIFENKPGAKWQWCERIILHVWFSIHLFELGIKWNADNWSSKLRVHHFNQLLESLGPCAVEGSTLKETGGEWSVWICFVFFKLFVSFWTTPCIICPCLIH